MILIDPTGRRMSFLGRCCLLVWLRGQGAASTLPIETIASMRRASAPLKDGATPARVPRGVLPGHGADGDAGHGGFGEDGVGVRGVRGGHLRLKRKRRVVRGVRGAWCDVASSLLPVTHP